MTLLQLLRALWPDHIPQHLVMFDHERAKVRSRAEALQRQDRKRFRKHLIFACVGAASALPIYWWAVIRGVWILLPLYASFMIAHIWYIQHDRALYVRRALRERGFDVCPRCAYDLSALRAETDRCPECGTSRETLASKTC
jgi:hypothetical protein